MIAVASSADVVPRRSNRPDRPMIVTHFLGRPKDMRPGPQCFMLEALQPTAVVRPHYHAVNQFQIFWRGGMAGRDPGPGNLAVHYADAFTSYGPIESNSEQGFRYLTVRAAPDPGPQYMPEAREGHRGGRRIDVVGRIPGLGCDETAYTDILPTQYDGLSAGFLEVPPGLPVPGRPPWGGLHYVVLHGEVRRGEQLLGPMSSVFTDQEAVDGLAACSSGAVLLALRFPLPWEPNVKKEISNG